VTLVQVREPLVLISQVQRSGGTLLSQLFDGHPECHAHPAELHIGPNKSLWPALEPGDPPEAWFDALFERVTLEFIENGYSKTTEGARRAGTFDVLPFRFDPELQRSIFLAEAEPGSTSRQILDSYMTSYFNAWLDNANLRTGPKRVVTAFAAALAFRRRHLAAFFDDYPDGTLVTIVREPRGWFESSRRYKARYESVDRAVKTWSRSTRASLEASERYGDRTIVLSFEQLVQETEPLMRRLAERLGLTFSDELLVPTFNGRSIRAASSGAVQGYGVIPEPARRPELDSQTDAEITRATAELYAAAHSRILEP
jgi:Sulfotransferase family